MQVIVDEISDLTNSIRSFVLRSNDGKQLPSFSAGAHINVNIMLSSGITTKRKYSILSDPKETCFYEIAVLRECDGTGGSDYMHSQVHKGKILEISEPLNQFPLIKKDSHHILIVGGIGITPLLSMMHVLYRNGLSFEVHYAAKSSKDFIFKERILALAGTKAYFYPTEGKEKRSLNLEILLTNIKSNVEIYAGGPLRMYKSLNEIVNMGSISSNRLHYESFGVCQENNGNESMAVLSRTGRSILINNDQTMFDALTESGVSLDYDCMRGECGMCAIEYRDGKIIHRDNCLSDDERNSFVCVCVSKIESKNIELVI